MRTIARIEGHVATIEGAGVLPFERIWDALQSLDDSVVRVVVLAIGAAAPDGAPLAPEDALALERFLLPTVAALSGDIEGSALVLALACDIRAADATTRLMTGSAPAPRLRTLIGKQPLPPGPIEAAAALDLGLVTEVSAPGDVLAAASRIAAVIASRGPIATAFAKEAIWRGLPQPLEQGLRFETDLTLLLQTTQDRAEGVTAFKEKRLPAFKGFEK